MDALVGIFKVLFGSPYLLGGIMLYWTFKNWHSEWLHIESQTDIYGKLHIETFKAWLILAIDILVSAFLSFVLGLKGSAFMVILGLFGGNLFSTMFISGRLR